MILASMSAFKLFSAILASMSALFSANLASTRSSILVSKVCITEVIAALFACRLGLGAALLASRLARDHSPQHIYFASFRTLYDLLIGPVLFLDASVWPISGISERNQKPIESDVSLNFQPLRTYFEEEAATSTPRSILKYISEKPL